MSGEGDGIPMFCLPGITRNPLALSKLMKRLALNAPCYGIEIPASNGKERFETLEQIADYCMEQIIQVRLRDLISWQGIPSGDYLRHSL